MIVTKDFRGSPDGNTICNFIKGESVALNDERMSKKLWDIAITEGWITEEKAESLPENKAQEKPSNKARASRKTKKT